VTLACTALARPPGLAEATLALRPGEITGLIGPNGAGKTTLLRALAGLSAGPGAVTLDGQPLATLSPDARARRLAWLPAERQVGWPLLARDVVALGLPGRRDAAAVDRALSRTDTAALAGRRIDRLSTGERARVLLARALVASPGWLLLDEPVANLDLRHQLDLLDLLRGEAARGAGVVLSLHDLTLADAACDRLVLLDAGRIVADGAPAGVLTPDVLATVFGVARTSGGWARG
jgi:iron complex transport system ATP-binding protein